MSELHTKFNKNDYEPLGQWVSPVLEYELWLDWANTSESKNLGLPSLPSPWLSIDGNYFRLKKDAHAYVKEKALGEFRAGKYDFVESILNQAKNICQECIVASEKVSKDISFDEFLAYYDVMRRLRFPWMSSFPIDEAATEYIKEYAHENSLNADEILASVPQLPNSLTDDQKELLKFKQAIEKENLSSSPEIKFYQKKTEYIGTHHMWGEARTMERLLDAIEVVHENSQTAEVSKYADLPIISLMSQVSKWRLECAQSSARLAYTLRPTMTKWAQKAGITYMDIIQLSTKEIQKLIEGKLTDTSFIKARQDKFVFFRENAEIKVLTGKEYDEVAEIFGLNDSYEKVTSIKGNIGNKGKVTGIVAIVRKPQDNHKVKQGMILVAPETTPDLIPAMGQAAGFVTDQGGITSHAAIVAREMGKPCIIGTKIATKVLKDGDVVEVDAEKGIVIIIK